MNRNPDAYVIKGKEESVWVPVQTAIVAVVTTALINSGVDTTLAGVIGGFFGSISRPVLGYLIGWLPRPKATA